MMANKDTANPTNSEIRQRKSEKEDRALQPTGCEMDEYAYTGKFIVRKKTAYKKT